MLRLLLLVSAFSTCIASTANAVVLCARARGDGTFNTSVKIREACRPTETQLHPVALGLQGPAGPIGPSGPTGSVGPQGPAGPAAVVKDANGALVGVVVGTAPIGDPVSAQPPGNGTTVIRRVGSVPIEFYVTDTGFPEMEHAGLEFSNANCTGAPMVVVVAWVTAPLVARAVVVKGTTAYYPTGPLVPGLYGASRLRVFGYDAASCAADGGTFNPPTGCCLPGSFGGPGGTPVAALDLTTLGLVPPFHVEGP